MTRVVFSHCMSGRPDFIWYPHAIKAFEAAGLDVTFETLPNTTDPKFSEWLPALTKLVGEPSDDVIILAHSLGCINALRYLETLEPGQRVRGVVMVAGFTDNLNWDKLNSFFQTPLDLDKVKQRAGKFICLHSDNDRFLDPNDPFKHAFLFLEHLKAKLIIMPGANHFSIYTDRTELPEAISSVLEIAKP